MTDSATKSAPKRAASRKRGVPKKETSDIAIIGAGQVGLLMALALKKSAPELDVRLIDKRAPNEAPPQGAPDASLRAYAIAAAARRMLQVLGVWDKVAEHAEPITEMIVTDSRLSDPVRPVFLNFEGDVAPGEPFAHMISDAALMAVLRQEVKKTGVKLYAPLSVEEFTADGYNARLRFSDRTEIKARLVIGADGRWSCMRSLAGIKTVSWDYGQSAIVTTIAHERPHKGRAEEHFLSSGPFAILPLPDNRSSIVWSEKRTLANTLVSGDDFTFKIELERRFGHHLGALDVVGSRAAFPLGLMLSRSFVAPRLALIGDAAHAIHPISGQGLNMGFRDVAALTETLVEAGHIGYDIGSIQALERYQRWRRFDTWQMGAVTDGMTRLFSNDNEFLRFIRGAGMRVIDRLPGLKSMFIREAAGFSGRAPRLLLGEAV